jgi:RNA polymerase subunit RPABC4/transcription elongation factor Spt4
VPSSQWKPPENATSFVERDGSSHVEPPDAEHVALSKNGASEDHETRLVEHLERIDPGTSFNRLAAKNRAMLSHVAEPEVVSSIPYNTGFSQFEGEPVLRHADERTEREVVVEKDRCLVCDAILAGTTYICPTCETKYCMRCAKLMASNGDTCWRCKQPFDLAD